MNQFKFFFKQVLKNPLSYVPLVLILLACFGTLYLNNRAYQNNSRFAQVQESLNESAVLIKQYNAELATLDENSEQYYYTQKTVEAIEERVVNGKEFLAYYADKNWDKVYDMEVDNNRMVKENLTAEITDTLLLAAVEREYLMYQALAALDIPYEDVTFPTTTTQFTLSLFRYILPTLLPVGLAYVLSNLYGSSFIGKLNINHLLPASPKAVALKAIGAGVVYSLLTLATILLPLALVSGLVFGFGDANFPIEFRQLTDGAIYFDAVGKVILPTIGLHALSLVFIATLIYLITIVTKNKMTALFVSTVVLLSGILLPAVLAPVSAVAHLIPTTYVRSFDITTGIFQHAIENYQVTTGLGVLVLTISILLLVAIIFALQGRGKRLIIEKRQPAPPHRQPKNQSYFIA